MLYHIDGIDTSSSWSMVDGPSAVHDVLYDVDGRARPADREKYHR